MFHPIYRQAYNLTIEAEGVLKLFHGRSTINQSSFGQFATNSTITAMASNHEQRQLPRTNLAYN